MINSSHPDVAILAPGVSPGVFAQDVVEAGFFIVAVANSGHCVSFICAGAVEHSFRVVYVVITGGYGDRKRTLSQSLVKIVFAIAPLNMSFHAGVSLKNGGEAVCSATFLDALVGVLAFKVNAMHHVHKRYLEGTAIATTVARVAVNQFLLRSSVEGTILDSVTTFSGSHGSEGIARAAIILAFDTSNDTPVAPVNVDVSFCVRWDQAPFLVVFRKATFKVVDGTVRVNTLAIVFHAFASQHDFAFLAFRTDARFVLTLSAAIGASLASVDGSFELSSFALNRCVAVIALVDCSLGTVAFSAIDCVRLMAAINALTRSMSTDFAGRVAIFTPLVVGGEGPFYIAAFVVV